MFIDLSFNDLLRLFQLLMIEVKKLFHLNDNIINLSNFKTFMSHFVVSRIWIETHSRMKSFIEVERNHWSDWKDIEILAEFYHEYSLCSVVLHVITVNSKFAFNVFFFFFFFFDSYSIQHPLWAYARFYIL